MESKTHDIYSTSVPVVQNDDRASGRRMRGRYLDILFSFLVMTIPMLAFSALLLGLIYHYRIVRKEFPSENLSFAGRDDESSAIYVKLSATTLITVASWSSTIAPLLVGFSLTLLSYPLARTLLNAGHENRPDELPTPFQLSLMLRILTSGGPGSLWQWLTYAVGWRGRRQPQPSVLKRMTMMLCLGTFLSVLVFITDTWLHFTTKTINFTQVAPSNIAANHSYALLPNCTDNPTPFLGLSGCTLNPAAAVTFVMGGPTALQVLNNVSETSMVRTLAKETLNFAYLGNTPQPRLSSVDYTANTWAVQSQCTPVTTQCMDSDLFLGAGTPFKCPFAFEGMLESAFRGRWQMAYFTDSSATDNVTQFDPVPNPYYFSVAAGLGDEIGHTSDGLTNDPEIAFATHGGMVFTLFCNATVYDVEYSSVNNTITRFLYEPSNSSTTTIIQGTQQYTDLGTSLLQQALNVAAFSNSAQELADQFAVAYSRVALSAAAGAFVPQPAVETQLRQSILVARVLKAPLACLLLANLLLVVLGIILTMIALVAAKGETGEVQSRLSIPGLVADHFESRRGRLSSESIEGLFEEHSGLASPKIRISQTAQGGYSYQTVRQT